MMQNVIWGFLTRWGLELGGIATILIGAYMQAPPEHQEAIRAIFTGSGGDLPVNAILGLALYAWGRIAAYRATVAPQVVTSDGEKITPKKDSAVMGRIEGEAKAAPSVSLQPTLWERLVKKLSGN